MIIEEVIKKLQNIINYTLYESEVLTKELNEDKDNIIDYLNTSDNFLECIKEINKLKTKENNYVVDRYLSILLSSIKIDNNTITTLLNLDITTNIKYILWNKLKDKNKIIYLQNKDKLEDYDYELINRTIQNKKSKLFNLIMNNTILLEKLDENKLYPNTNLLNNINLKDNNILRILNSYTISKLVLKYNEIYQDFKNFIINNKSIITRLDNQSITLSYIDKNDFNTLLIKYPLLITKLNLANNKDYIEEQTVEAILNKTNESNIKTICEELLIAKNNNNIAKYFNKTLINQSEDKFLNVYPFDLIDTKLRDEIINNYNYLKKFSDETVTKLINEYATEEQKISLLRNNEFINNINPIYLEKILNKMSFKSVFNMLQNVTILNKINNINIENLEELFVDSYLDSPTLVNKANHEMIFNMLKLSNNIEKYIKLPYISSKLNQYEIIDILVSKKINIINTNNIIDRFNKKEIKYYLDKMLSTYPIDYNLIFNDYILQEILNIKFYLTKESIEDIKYLIDKIYTRGNQTTKCYCIDTDSIKAVIKCYKLLGLKNTNTIFEQGNKTISLESLNKLKKDYINEFLPPLNKNDIKNETTMLISILKDIKDATEDNETLIKLLKNNDHIKSLINFSKSVDYYDKEEIITTLLDYYSYKDYNLKKANENLHIFIENIYKSFNNIKYKEIESRFNNIIKNNFKVRESILYNTIENKLKNILDTFKLKTLKNILTKTSSINTNQNEIIDEYNALFNRSKYSIEDIINKIITPKLNNKSNDEILLNLGIIKPILYNTYLDVLEEETNINIINKKLNKTLSKYTKEEKIYILNNICYNSSIPFNIDVDTLELTEELKDTFKNYNGKIDVNKVNQELTYTNVIQFNNKKEILKYQKEVKKINNIIKKSINFISTKINDQELKAIYQKEYKKFIEQEKNNIPISNRNYELSERFLTLMDFKKVFKDIEIYNITLTKKDIDYIIKYTPYIADGYLDDFTKSFKTLFKNIPTRKTDNIYRIIKEVD